MRPDPKHMYTGKNDLPRLAKPAQWNLASAGIRSMPDLARFNEDDLAALPGIGKNALVSIRAALKENKLTLKP